MLVRLGELQRVYRAEQRKTLRRDLRQYLIERRGPTSGAFNAVARSLYVAGAIDNFGLADQWLSGATIQERAELFSLIATSLLGK
ncbi:MAG TPA: hypothetical protein VM822_16090 [Pseudolabrys sp.]|jgi:hypothetical protein|nr:hypothetical protein [Pseudolabrys sp.]